MKSHLFQFGSNKWSNRFSPSSKHLLANWIFLRFKTGVNPSVDGQNNLDGESFKQSDGYKVPDLFTYQTIYPAYTIVEIFFRLPVSEI